MIKDFSQRAILTTPNPEAFLNFRYESGDDVSVFITPYSIIPGRTFYINGIDATLYPSEGYKLILNADVSIASFHIFTRNFEDFDYGLSIDTVGTEINTYDVSISNRQFIIESNDINIYETSNTQIDDETSYLLLRTNPKFTGNIKIILDTSNNLYLDTFKISDILNNKKYRKQKVSGESVFSGDVRKTFATLPYGELYRLDAENTLNIAVPKTEIYKQYNLNYSYGARLFEDELYDDDYAMLAPLWINSKLPDYFSIFRINDVYNPETYDEANNLSGLALKYLQEGELIKTWGMKDTTPIGTYLRNHLNELLTVRSPLFLSLSDPTQKDPDPNTWYGVAVDKGIITGRSETPYFFDQKKTFTDTNAFLSEGFERLNLLCPNILNMEYVFSDEDASLYTMHRYFGLYLTENKLFELSYYAHDPDSSVQILSLDGKDSSIFFNSSIFDSSGNINAEYTNRIFTLNDIQKIKRITNVNQINGLSKPYVEEWLNKPGEQLFSTDVENKTTNKFITISLNRLLNQGEHLRILDKTNFNIWEIYAIDSELLEAGNAWPYASTYVDPSGTYPTVFRTAFSIKGSLSDQINAIKKAFDLFNEGYETSPPFETTIIKLDKASLSFEIKDYANANDIWFQRLTAQTVDNPNDPSSNFNTAAKYDDIRFYGVFDPSLNDFERLSYDASYGPVNFEIFGDRMSLTINLFDFQNNYMYSLDASLSEKFEEFTMYMGTDKWYRLISPFTITTTISYDFNYVTDPHELKDKIIVNTTNPIFKNNNRWNAYAAYPLVISLMGINSVKDIDFTVYDTSLGFQSEYWYEREDDIQTYSHAIASGSINIKQKSEFEIIQGQGQIYINDVSSFYDASTSTPFYFNTFDGSASIIASSPMLITYNQIDGSKSYTSYTGLSEENINNYYIDASTKSKLKYGLTVPYVTKWVALGTDCRNNPLRLLLDASLYDSSSNFIPYNGEFEGEISYPVFKYLDPGIRAWEEYLFFDINDIVQYDVDGSTIMSSFKELMIAQPFTDVFSKLVYSNYNITKTKLRSSIVYFNNYKNSIDSIIKGLNLSFFLDEVSKNTFNIQDWDRYKISFVSSPSRNRTTNHPIEIFINENTKTILIVWYQGADVLNYNKRYSTYFGGKSLLYDSSTSIDEFKSFNTGNKHWSFVKTPFVVNNASLSSDFSNIYGTAASYDSSICSPYTQINLNFGDSIYSIFNAYGNNLALSYSFQFFDTQYNTFKQYINYSYEKDSATFGSGILNYGYSYMNNANFYKENVCDLETFKHIININNINYYIFKGGVIYSNASFSVPPVIITINDPKNYKDVYTYSGWYRPKFNNILDFNYNEDTNVINSVKKDFTFSNTNFKEYKNIPQLWYNKVVNQVTTQDVSTKNAIGFIEDFNVFKSQWDSKYYVVDTSTSQTLVDGFNSQLELPSYFGSKLVKLPNELVLDSWEITTSRYYIEKNNYVLEFNLTRKIINLFKSTAVFTENWADLTTSDNIIDGYIKTTILGYYNIGKSKSNIEIWTKPFDGSNVLTYNFDSSFTLDKAANVDAVLNSVNNEYLYSIKVPIKPAKNYFVKFKLFEK